jgi:hypothetical protein
VSAVGLVIPAISSLVSASVLAVPAELASRGCPVFNLSRLVLWCPMLFAASMSVLLVARVDRQCLRLSLGRSCIHLPFEECRCHWSLFLSAFGMRSLVRCCAFQWHHSDGRGHTGHLACSRCPCASPILLLYRLFACCRRRVAVAFAGPSCDLPVLRAASHLRKHSSRLASASEPIPCCLCRGSERSLISSAAALWRLFLVAVSISVLAFTILTSLPCISRER